ncbi:hypothetical protein LTR08_005833 [Meristemomyces frigidus]|nr:hypothetical protein LTR08_005833 [Meristemomyces frigidus]
MTFHPTLSEARTYIEGFLGYTFVNIDWLEEALWAYPTTLSSGKNLIDGNKSLAVVGDAVLHIIVAEQCYDQGMIRGDANNCLKLVVSNPSLGQLARAHGISQFVITNPGTGQMSDYMRATAVEAVLGAVIKDNGYDYDVLRRAVAAFGVI